MKSPSVAQAFVLCAMLAIVMASPTKDSKARKTRGFKDTQLSTARGFGKRGGFQFESIEPYSDPSRELFGRVLSERTESDSFPVDWLAEEIAGNPELVRLIISRFIDRNQDGELSAEELFRTSY